jgi:hypothetical protein
MKVYIKDNIYPYSKENVKALIEFYFLRKGMSFVPGDLKHIYENKAELTISQLEFIAENISNNLNFFKDNLTINGLTISNLLKYGIDAYQSNFKNGSKNRITITKEFQKIMFNNNCS